MIKSGADLRHERKALGITQTAFAQLCFVARNTLIEWEKRDKLPFVLALGLDELLIRLRWAKDRELPGRFE